MLIIKPDITLNELYAAILEQPDEDTLRLVFADRLDELGHHDRARFIRMQVEQATLERSADGTPEAHRWKVLDFECNHLLKNNSYWNLIPCPEHGLKADAACDFCNDKRGWGVSTCKPTFRRGFVDSLHVDSIDRVGRWRTLPCSLCGGVPQHRWPSCLQCTNGKLYYFELFPRAALVLHGYPLKRLRTDDIYVDGTGSDWFVHAGPWTPQSTAHPLLGEIGWLRTGNPQILDVQFESQDDARDCVDRAACNFAFKKNRTHW